MLLYSLFHLFGYGDLSIDDIKNFRQTGSLTPGTSGVQTYRRRRSNYRSSGTGYGHGSGHGYG